MEAVMQDRFDTRQQVEELPLKENEFTGSELLLYLNNAYGGMMNGTSFTIENLIRWLQLGKIAEAYGGNALSAREMSGVRIFTVVGLTREELRYVRDSVAELPALEKSNKKTHTRRTKLFYQIAGMPVPDNALPSNWRQLGIRGNQLTQPRKKYLHRGKTKKK